MYFIHLFMLYISLNSFCLCNKYSEHLNKKFDPTETVTYINFRTLEKPFRMAKLNVLWSKAQIRLTDVKLKSFFSDLKIHDKEEIAWKKMKAEGMDNDGLREAEMRSKLTGIMSTYGLLEHFEDISDPSQLKMHKFHKNKDDHYLNKSLFKDQRLNLLWHKAEKAGFRLEELQALKEEFDHHQEKVDQYYAVLNDVENTPIDEKSFNSIDTKEDKFNALSVDEQNNDSQFHAKAAKLRDLHSALRSDYDRLHHITAKGPNSQEFIEPQVEGLWRMALEANFSNDELLSLKAELSHYENRLLKLRHLHAEAATNAERDALKREMTNIDKPSEGTQILENNIKKSVRKVDKLRLELETRIMQRHIEL